MWGNLTQQQQGTKRNIGLQSFTIVVNTVDQFYGCDIVKYLRYYKREIEANHISETEMINNFEIGVVLKIENKIKELPTSHWNDFMQTLTKMILCYRLGASDKNDVFQMHCTKNQKLLCE